MPAEITYLYRARDGAGNEITGTAVATSPDEVGARLRAEGKFVVSVEDRTLRPTVQLDEESLRRNEAAKRVRREDVIAFCQQLSVMLETGVPLSEALEAFCGQVPRRDFRTVLHVLRDDIYAGESFSSAMARWPRVFPTMMISLMKASEASGTMSSMLGRIGHYLAKERRTVRQIKGALAYPVFMMSAGLAMTVFLLSFVLPRFAKIYETRSASLPMPTQVLLSISELITTQYLVYGPVLVGLALVLAVWVRQPSGRRMVDGLRLHVPLLRLMYRRLYVTRAARTMSTLLAAGVSLIDIIDICRGVTNNSRFDALWDEMEHDVRNGRQLSEAVIRSPYVTANVSSMIASGERSGRLAEVMERIAEFTEEELDGAVKQVTSFIEPIMILLMGAVVGGIAIALLLPVFSMGRVMAGG
jgi:type IV pilus assembly protein PilC